MDHRPAFVTRYVSAGTWHELKTRQIHKATCLHFYLGWLEWFVSAEVTRQENPDFFQRYTTNKNINIKRSDPEPHKAMDSLDWGRIHVAYPVSEKRCDWMMTIKQVQLHQSLQTLLSWWTQQLYVALTGGCWAENVLIFFKGSALMTNSEFIG